MALQKLALGYPFGAIAGAKHARIARRSHRDDILHQLTWREWLFFKDYSSRIYLGKIKNIIQ